MIYKGENLRELCDLVVAQKPSSKELILLFVGEANRLSLRDIHSELLSHSIRFVACVVPGVINASGFYDKAILVKKSSSSSEAIIIEDGSDSDYSQDLSKYDQNGTLLLMVDNTFQRKQDLLFNIYDKLLVDVTAIGGVFGRMNDSEERENILVSHTGIYENAAALIWIDQNSKVSGRHGFSKFYGPLIANKNELNEIKQLNWRNAAQVYLSVMAEKIDFDITSEEAIQKLAMKFPIGIYKEADEGVIRDVFFDDGKLNSLNLIEDDTVVNIMHYKEGDLEQAAKMAIEQTLALVEENKDITDLFVVDCISRQYMLGKDYQSSLELISKASESTGIAFEGVSSIGEISSTQSSIIELDNKVVITSAFYND